MSKKSKILLFISIFILILLFVIALTISNYKKIYNIYFDNMSNVVGVVSKLYPDSEEKIINSFKEVNTLNIKSGKQILLKYGYNINEYNIYPFQYSFYIILIQNIAVITLLIFIFIGIMIYLKLSLDKKLKNILNYLFDINSGDYKLYIRNHEEGYFSFLEDELYKTTIMLRESKEKIKQEKANFVDNIANISHQIKTPITSISIMVELLENSIKSDKEKLYIEKINFQIEKINYLVTSLLKLSKFDTGIIEIESLEINVKQMVLFVLKNLSIQLNSKEQTVNLIGEQYVSYIGDFNWSSEAISNIIKNCSEHTQSHGEINITFKQNPICTLIVIEDNGQGIAKEDLPNIFDRFYRGKNSKKDSLGIGLALSKTIIQTQNGEIYVENKIPNGAIFTIKFYKYT